MYIKKIPFLFVLLLVFTVPWQMIVAFPEFGTISRIIGYMAVAVAGLYILIYQKIKEPSVVILVMILFILWSLLSYFWGLRPEWAIGRFVTNIQLLAMVWLLWELVNTKKEVLWCLQIFIFGSYVSIIDMLLSYYTGQFTTFRVSATGFDPNQLAISLALGIPIAWYLFSSRMKNSFFIINLLYIPLAIFCIILTASRGGFVTAILALSIIPFTLLQLDLVKRGIVIVCLIIFGVIGIYKFPAIAANLESNIDRIYMLSENIDQRDLGIRGTLIRHGMQIFQQNPLLGVGARSFRVAVVEVGHHRAHSAHNSYISVLVEFGLIGFILFMAIFVFAGAPHIYNNGLERYFYLVLFLTLCIGMFPLNWEANKIPWLMFAFLMLQKSFVFRRNKLTLIENTTNAY